jgi:hypothetical protein
MARNALLSLNAECIARASLTLPRFNGGSLLHVVEVVSGNGDKYLIAFRQQSQRSSDGAMQGYWRAEWAKRFPSEERTGPG